jgi:hypothetical protein
MTDQLMAPLRSRGGIPFCIDLTASGNTVLVTPAADERITLTYIEYSSGGADLITVAIRFGVAGTLYHKSYLKEGGMSLRNMIQAEISGGYGEVLYGNLSATGTVAITGRYLIRKRGG